MKHTQQQLVMPFLETLDQLGGKAKPKDMYEALAKKISLPEEEKNETLECKNMKFKKWNRTVRWIKETLKIKKFVESPERGLWQLTENAKSFLNNAKPGILVTVYEVINDKGETQGLALWGEVSSAKGIIEDNSINMILTSPPYPLTSPKDYGNVNEKQYLKWFLPIAEQMYKSLTPDGSLVLNVSSVFQKGTPVQSLYIHRLILALCDEIGFFPAQEFFWHNSAAMPSTPWVTIKRVRVKQAVENVLWLSKTPYPKANNRNVLEPYSEKYLKVLDKGGYGNYTRPCGHTTAYFNKNNGGKIPSNLLVYSNSSSRNPYINYCKEKNLPIHPARFPKDLPRFFIKLLTDENDLIWDTFAGSNTIGEVCLEENRRFLITEKSLSYLYGSLGRFNEKNLKIYEPLKTLCSI